MQHSNRSMLSSETLTCKGAAMDGCQEVALVLQRVCAPQELVSPALTAAGDAGIVPCRHRVSPQALAVLQEGPKLDVAVACQVRVGCHAFFTLQKVRRTGGWGKGKQLCMQILDLSSLISTTGCSKHSFCQGVALLCACVRHCKILPGR